MWIFFLALLGLLHVINSGVLSVVDSHITTGLCPRSQMTVDHIWLVESCSSTPTMANVYKWNNITFQKLPYTIPLPYANLF